MKDPEIDVMSTIGLETPKSDAEIEMHEAVLNPEFQTMAMRDGSFLCYHRKRCTTAPTQTRNAIPRSPPMVKPCCLS
jgi:hypothetical protein